MDPFVFLQQIIDHAAQNTALLSLTIALGTFFLEDTTTIVVGILAADGVIPVPVAMGSLYAGIFIGDICLYCLGWLAGTNSRLARFVDHDFVVPFRAWLETRYILTIFTARFIPGARLPTYTTTGFFRSPLSTFILVAAGATTIWTTFLFSASYWFGNVSAELGPVRWIVALVILLALFFIGRHNVLAYRSKNNTHVSNTEITD